MRDSAASSGSRRRATELVAALDTLALVREARRGTEPDPAAAAVLAELAGADGISVGLRTDRRHVQERDVKVLRATVKTRLQVRIAPTPESIKIVTPIRPDLVVLVPERAESLGHETGHDLAVAGGIIAEAAGALREAGLDVMVLVDPDVENVKNAHRLGLAGVSLLGSRLGGARLPETLERELDALEHCVRLASKLGLVAQVAHGLDARSARHLAGLPGLAAVEVGHALCARASLVGMERSVAELKAALA